MRLLADENIPAPLVKTLRQQGIDLLYVAELHSGLSDADVLALPAKEGRPILTEDRDFGEMVFRQKKAVPGIVMLRLPAAERAHWARVAKLLRAHEQRLLGAFVVIGAGRLRIRPLPRPG